MSRKIGEGKFSEKSSGKSKYSALWLYIPSKLVNDYEFPFKTKDRVQIEIVEGKLVVSKKNELMNIINNFGIENATIPYLLEKKAQKNKNKPFLYFKDEIYSYKDLNKNSNRIAHGILSVMDELKINRPRIAIMLPNCPEFFFSWFGASKAGCVNVFINIFLEEEILEHILTDSKASILIIDYPILNKYKNIINKISHIKKIVVRNPSETFKVTGKYIDFNAINTADIKNPDVEVKSWHKMEILYTGGATRKPKGIFYRYLIMLIGLFITQDLEGLAFDKSDIIYLPLPLFNGFSRLTVVFSALFADASIAISEKFDANIFWQEVKKYNATGICYFGWLLSLLLKQPPKESDRDHNVKWAFGSVAEYDIWDSFENRFGIPLIESWTLAEGGVTINFGGSKEGKKGSIGRPVIGFEVKIVDKEGKELPPGRENIGEILSKMNLPISLDSESKDSWSHTGDLGYKDKDGYIYFVGREKDIIFKNNRMYNLKNIEKMTNLHPFVQESAVINVPGDTPEQTELKISITLKKPGSLTHKDIFDYLSENLPYFMIPRYIEFKKEIYKSPTERITTYSLKREWEDEKVKKNTWDSKTKDFIK